MERETTQHSGRLDDAMAKETDSLTHGAPVEARVDENRLQEDAADDEPVAESLVSGEPAGGDFYGPSYRATRERSELASHLRPSIFPATPTVLVQCAREEHADDALVDRLSALPNRSYENPTQVWEALGGETEPTRTGFAKREPIPDSPVPDEMVAGPHDATASLPVHKIA